MVDEIRTWNEIKKLTVEYPCSWDFDEAWVEIHEFPLPSGWSPRPTTVLIELPETYPIGEPAVYFPAEVNYHGEPTHLLFRPDSRGLRKFCIHELEKDFDGGYTSLFTLMTEILIGMNDPEKNYPTE